MADTEVQAQQTEENRPEEKQTEPEEEAPDTDEWKQDKYRVKVAERIQDEITRTESEVPKSAQELEEFVFSKATSKRTYLDLIARILVYVAGFNKKKLEKEAEKAKAEDVETEKEDEKKEEAADS